MEQKEIICNIDIDNIKLNKKGLEHPTTAGTVVIQIHL